MKCTIVSYKFTNFTGSDYIGSFVGVNLNLQSDIVEFMCAAGTALSHYDALNLMGIE